MESTEPQTTILIYEAWVPPSQYWKPNLLTVLL